MAFAELTIRVNKREADPSRGLPETIKAMINPTQYQVEKSVQLAEIGIPGLDSPLIQFVRGQSEKLTLELLFDTTHKGMGDDSAVEDVRKRTRPLQQLVKVQPRTHTPPRVRVTWASLDFRAVVESVRQTFTLFTPGGVPVRATVAVTFREYRTLQDQLKELNLQSPDRTRTRTVKLGDSLDGLAFEEYGDVAQWHVIADANAAVLPSLRRLRPGTVLRIPPLPEVRG
jgi:hypothetical protein